MSDARAIQTVHPGLCWADVVAHALEGGSIEEAPSKCKPLCQVRPDEACYCGLVVGDELRRE